MSTGSPGEIVAGQAVVKVGVDDVTVAALARISARVKAFAKLNSGVLGITMRSISMLTRGVMGSIRLAIGTLTKLFNVIKGPLVFGSIGTAFATGAALRNFVPFEDALLELRGILHLSNNDLEDMKEFLLDISKTSSFAAKEIAAAAVALAKADFSPSEIKDSTQAVLDLARSGRIELSESADAIANVIKTYELSTKDVGHVASTMIVAANKGTMDVRDLIESLKFVSGTAHELGVPFEEVAAGITSFSFAGFKGSLAGTGFNQMLTQLVKNAKKLEDVGVLVADKDTGVFRGIEQIFTDIRAATATMGEVERGKFLIDVFNVRGKRPAENIMRAMEAIVGFREELKLTRDEARELSVMMDSGMGGSIRRLFAALGYAGNRFVETFEEGFISTFERSSQIFVEFGDNLKDRFAEMNDSLAKTTESFREFFQMEGMAGSTLVDYLKEIIELLGKIPNALRYFKIGFLEMQNDLTAGVKSIVDNTWIRTAYNLFDTSTLPNRFAQIWTKKLKDITPDDFFVPEHQTRPFGFLQGISDALSKEIKKADNEILNTMWEAIGDAGKREKPFEKAISFRGTTVALPPGYQEQGFDVFNDFLMGKRKTPNLERVTETLKKMSEPLHALDIRTKEGREAVWRAEQSRLMAETAAASERTAKASERSADVLERLEVEP